MIIREYFKTRSDGVALYRTYSDAGYLIRQEQTGAEYSEAIDVDGASYTYAETEKMIPEVVDGEQEGVELPNEQIEQTA